MLLTRRHLLYSALGSTAGLLAGSEPLFAREMAPGKPRCAFLAFNTPPDSNAPHNLAPIARQQVARALLATRRWVAAPVPFPNDIFPASTILDSGFKAERQQLLGLGYKTGADIVVWGLVTWIRFTEHPRRAMVTIAVHVDDARTGYQINGAIETGFSSVHRDRLPHSDQALIEQAISNSAYNIAKTINSYQIPTAVILDNHSSNEVIIDRGSPGGITPNLNMIVFRGRERISQIRITRVRTHSAVAILVHGSLPQAGDRATAIYEMPGYTVTPDAIAYQAPLRKPGQVPRPDDDSW